MRIITCLFLSIFATIVHHSAAAVCGTREGEYIWDGSTERSLPTNITEFRENLNDSLYQLPTNLTEISRYGWAAVYSGFGTLNAAYTQARCIGYLDFTTCLDCMQNATNMLKEDCFKEATSAILWYGDICMVRYSNHDMVGIIQMPDKMIRVHNRADFSVSPIPYEGLSRFFNLLARRTAYPRLFEYQMLAAGKWSLSKQTIFGVAQCSPDLGTYQCIDCLAIVGQNIQRYMDGKTVGLSIVGPSCNFRYEVYPFISNTRFEDLTSGKGSSSKALSLIYIVALLLIISIIW